MMQYCVVYRGERPPPGLQVEQIRNLPDLNVVWNAAGTGSMLIQSEVNLEEIRELLKDMKDWIVDESRSYRIYR